MVKKIGISFIALAILIVLMSGTLPHHHHENGTVCFFMAHCEKDHETDHVHSDQKNNACRHDASCVVETSYYTNPQNELKIKTPSCDNCDNTGHFHLFPLFYLDSDLLINPVYNCYTKPKKGEQILFYTSDSISRIHSLRAPPFILS